MKKKVAIIGFGGMGHWHYQQITANDVVEVKGIYDLKESRRQFAKDNGIFVYSSNEELLADEEVDIILVATSNDAHKEMVIKALEAGKNVICEKPVEMTCAAFDEMVAAAKRSGKLFTVHQNRRWDIDFLAMKKLCEEGLIGEPLHIESRVHGSRGIPGDWRGLKAYGGGMILDWGVHLIDQILQIFKAPITRVYCDLTHITNDEVDDGFTLHLYFEDGKSALIEVGTYNFISMPRFYLLALKGSAIINEWTLPAKVTRLTTWNEKVINPVKTAAGITKTMAPRDCDSIEEFELELMQSDVHDFYRNVVATIDGKSEIVVKLPEVRRVLKVMEAAFESGEKHQAIEVNI